VIEKIFQSPFFEKFKASLLDNKKVVVEKLNDLGKASLLSYLHRELDLDILVISQGNRETRLFDDLKFFKTKVLEFPSWEALPEEGIVPSLDIVGRRMEVLNELSHHPKGKVVFAPIQSLLQQVPSTSEIKKVVLKIHEERSFEKLELLFKEYGYEQVKLVQDKGQYAIRGGIIDIFPVSSYSPYRLEFFGDEITMIRQFDPMSQHSIDKVSELELYPCLEHQAKAFTYLINYLKPNRLIIFDDPVSIEDAYYSLKKLIDAVGSKLLTFDQFLESIQNSFHLFFIDQSVEEIGGKTGYEKVGRKFYQDPLIPQKVFLELFNKSFVCHLIFAPLQTLSSFFDLTDTSLEAQQLELVEKIEKDPSYRLIMTASTELELEGLKKFFSLNTLSLAEYAIDYISSGLVIEDIKTIILSHAEFFRRFKITRKKWRNTYHTPLSDFHQLSSGDYVVHLNSGVAKYLGIEKQKNHLGQESEFLILEYAENSKLFVPINQSHLVSRYIGVKEEKPQLNALGTQKWTKAKVLAQKSIIGYAKDLLQLQAEREIQGGFVYPEDSLTMRAFEEEFPYQETEDQLKAIQDIKKDMQSKKAMDRLICGDVGYGKTEVAMRAAFKAVLDGKRQVAVLVPTTILAVQHYETFKQRMASFNVKVEVICRFKTAKEIKKILERLSDGKVDILIGTQRLLSADVLFKELGLVIIDEEQKFGVRAKEKLKKIKAGVDCITMSATPIPRTLYFSLISAKELSVINSPPHDRLPIKTILCDKDETVIQQALLRELSRDGQAYFIHNRVESIFDESAKIQKLLPAAKIQVVHGQMEADDIEMAFHAFKSGFCDVLVATSIVENGIDIPNANTIIIDRAEQFGISDLYQLRGRVGRHNKPSYAYFMTPKFQRLQEATQKRLKALVESSGFGGGMKLAMLDLEIRGAGDILGTQQSGHVSTIGFHLYCKLLKKTIDAMMKKKPTTFLETKIEFPFPAKIPEYYLPDTSLRLEFYHRLGEASSEAEVDELIAELKDRFGKYPEEVSWLQSMTKIKLRAIDQGITLLKIEKFSLIIEKLLKDKTEKKQLFIKEPKSPEELEKLCSQFLKK
jgi:transcription-repair coupling factor (superfamily II helicase)